MSTATQSLVLTSLSQLNSLPTLRNADDRGRIRPISGVVPPEHLAKRWYEIGHGNPWVKEENDPPFRPDAFEHGYFFTLLDLAEYLDSSYWTVGSTFWWTDGDDYVCFINQAIGQAIGGEWLVIVNEYKVESFTVGENWMRPDGIRENVLNLLKRAKHLKSLGVTPHMGNMVWNSDWFEEANPGDPYLWVLDKAVGFYERVKDADAPLELLIHWEDDSYILWDGQKSSDFPVERNWANSAYDFLDAQGFLIADMGQGEHLGTCYAKYPDIRRALIAHNFPSSKPEYFDALLQEAK